MCICIFLAHFWFSYSFLDPTTQIFKWQFNSLFENTWENKQTNPNLTKHKLRNFVCLKVFTFSFADIRIKDMCQNMSLPRKMLALTRISSKYIFHLFDLRKEFVSTKFLTSKCKSFYLILGKYFLEIQCFSAFFYSHDYILIYLLINFSVRL